MSTYTVTPTSRKPASVGGKGVRATVIARAIADHERTAQALADALGEQRRILRALATR